MSLSTSITTKEAATRLGLHPETVRKWCERTGFGFRLGGRWRIPENRISEIERAVAACEASMPSFGAQRA